MLKQGDWMLKTAQGWHLLKKTDLLDQALQFAMRGELFIFDELVKENGKSVVKGHLFDEMRVQMVPVSIPIISEKEKAKKHENQKRRR